MLPHVIGEQVNSLMMSFYYGSEIRKTNYQRDDFVPFNIFQKTTKRFE